MVGEERERQGAAGCPPIRETTPHEQPTSERRRRAEGRVRAGTTPAQPPEGHHRQQPDAGPLQHPGVQRPVDEVVGLASTPEQVEQREVGPCDDADHDQDSHERRATQDGDTAASQEHATDEWHRTDERERVDERDEQQERADERPSLRVSVVGSTAGGDDCPEQRAPGRHRRVPDHEAEGVQAEVPAPPPRLLYAPGRQRQDQHERRRPTIAGEHLHCDRQEDQEGQHECDAGEIAARP